MATTAKTCSAEDHSPVSPKTQQSYADPADASLSYAGYAPPFGKGIMFEMPYCSPSSMKASMRLLVAQAAYTVVDDVN